MDRIRYLNDLARRCRPGISLIIGVLLALVAGTAAANGGAIILAETIGPYNVRVTADPYPLQVGVNDIRVLLGRLADAQIILDADVTITAQPLDAPGEAATFPANHDLATDDRYYASNTVFSAAGPWKLIVAVDGPAGPINAEIDVDVEPGPETATTPATAAPRPSRLYLILGGGLVLLIVAGLLAWRTLPRRSKG